jgi:hypothetical protein
MIYMHTYRYMYIYTCIYEGFGGYTDDEDSAEYEGEGDEDDGFMIGIFISIFMYL